MTQKFEVEDIVKLTRLVRADKFHPVQVGDIGIVRHLNRGGYIDGSSDNYHVVWFRHGEVDVFYWADQLEKVNVD